MYKTLYEEALAQLKNNKSLNFNLSLRDLSLKHIDPQKIERVVEKVKNYVQSEEPTNNIEFESQEETLIFCETLKMLYRTEKDKIDIKIREVNEKLQEFEILQQEYELIDDALQEINDSHNSQENRNMSSENFNIQKLTTFGNESITYTDKDISSFDKKTNMRYSPVDEIDDPRNGNSKKANEFKLYDTPSTLSNYNNLDTKKVADINNANDKTYVPHYTNKQPSAILQSKLDPHYKISTNQEFVNDNDIPKKRNLTDYFLNKDIPIKSQTTTYNNTSPDFVKNKDTQVSDHQSVTHNGNKKDPYAKPAFLVNHTNQAYGYGSKR